MRSINTGLVALLPVGGLLFIGAGLLGAGTLKDLGLVLFIGMGVAVYSSIFFATPVLAELKVREPRLQAHEHAGGGPPRGALRPSRPPRAAPRADSDGVGRAAGSGERSELAGSAPRPGRPRRNGRPRAGEAAQRPAAGPAPAVADGCPAPSVHPARASLRSGARAAFAGGGNPVEIAELVASKVVDVPDFPKPGILFKDLMPLFADGAGVRRRRSTRSSPSTARTASTWSPGSRPAAS